MAKKFFTDNSLQAFVNEIKDYTNDTVNKSVTNITSGDTIVAKATTAETATKASNADEATHAASATKADSATTAASATKATQDASGNVITSTYETKSDAIAKLNTAKKYTDDKIATISLTPGPEGPQGDPGAAATITIGTVTTGNAGTNASVTNVGTANAAKLNFTIPRGANGSNGSDGKDGTAATITVGTVTTGTAGSSASVTNVGSATAAKFNFTIPQGIKGDKGDTGATGPAGTSVTVSNVSTSTASGGSNVVTFSDGKTLTVKNGINGTNGTNGTNGVTPTIKAASGTAIGTVGTPSVTASTSGTTTTFTFNYLKGEKGDPGQNGTNGTNGTTPTIKAAAGTNINTVGTPSVTASTSGTTTTFTFNNLKGATGSQGPKGDTGTTPTIKATAGSNIGTVGTPSVSASTSGTTTTFTFDYLKGAKGDKGDPGTNATTTSVATTSANGLMSSAMVTKLNGIATGANAYTHPSTHAASMITGLATVATSGSYNDLSNKPTIPTAYTLPTASSSTLGGVKTTSTVTSTSGLTACPIISGVPYYKDTNTNTTYSAGTGISLSGTTFSNSGVRSIATGSSNGTISVNTNGTSANVAVKGLGSAAYTASTAYATSAQGTKADNAMPKSGGTFTDTVRFNAAATFTSGADFNYDVTAKRITIDNNYAIRWNSSDNNYEPIALLMDKTDDLLLGAPSSSVPHAGNTYIYASNGIVRLYNKLGTYLYWGSSTGTNYNGVFGCSEDGKPMLGDSSHRWYQVYATKSAIQTSDEREKSDITSIADYPVMFSRNGSGNVLEQLFDKLVPKTYTLNSDSTGELHIGFVAQDVAAAAEELGIPEDSLGLIDHSYWTDEETGEEKDRYGLAYEEFMALNTYVIQKQKERITEQETRINDLEERLAKIEAAINA